MAEKDQFYRNILALQLASSAIPVEGVQGYIQLKDSHDTLPQAQSSFIILLTFPGPLTLNHVKERRPSPDPQPACLSRTLDVQGLGIL